MKKDFGSVIKHAKAQLSGKPPYFYDPLVPAGPPEDLVHALGPEGRLDQVGDRECADNGGLREGFREGGSEAW